MDFLHLFNAAKASPGRVASFLRTHAMLDVFRRQHLEMGLNIFAQFPLESRRRNSARKRNASTRSHSGIIAPPASCQSRRPSVPNLPFPAQAAFGRTW